MDSIDSFYQELDSKQLLDRHGQELVAEARDILAKSPEARVAGVIVPEDSRDAGPMRAMLSKLWDLELPAGLLVGIVPRPMVEAVLVAYGGDERWKEQAWQTQQVLPVVVSTRDGFRFAFYGLDAAAGAGGG